MTTPQRNTIAVGHTQSVPYKVVEVPANRTFTTFSFSKR